jgi:hypothetical protein
MMVICPTHHTLMNNMPEAKQRELKGSPFNIKNGLVNGELALYQDYCAVEVGNNFFVGEGPFLIIDGLTMLELNLGESRTMELSLTLYSECGELLLEIIRNEWVSGDPLPWDIEAKSRHLTIRHKARSISLSLDLSKIPATLRADFWHNGKLFQCRPDKLSTAGGSPVKVSVTNFAFVGALEIKSEGVAICVARPGQESCMISQGDRRLRLQMARDAWRKQSRNTHC